MNVDHQVGSEYPLMTNLALVRKLQSVTNGVGFVDIKHPWPAVAERWKHSWKLPEEKGNTAVSWFGGYYR